MAEIVGVDRPDWIDELPLDVQHQIAVIEAIAAASSMVTESTRRARAEAERRPDDGPWPASR